MGSKETPIQKAILSLLAGIFPAPHLDRCFWRQNAGGGLRDGRPIKAARPGTPDIFIFYHGMMTCIEVKSAKGTLNPEQREYRDWLLDQQGRYIVARSVDEALDGLVAAGILKRDVGGAISRT